jgi:hypothetical protein
MLRRALAVLAAFALAALGWLAAGWLVGLLGLGELDLPARAGGVFLALTRAERRLAGLAAFKGEHR